MAMKYFVSAIIAVVAIAIAVSLYVIGSPQTARLRRFDDLRTQNLQFIQDQVFSYWQYKKTVPATLADLVDDIHGVTVPSDPETGMAYSYEKKGSEQFTLCANFSLPTKDAVFPDTTKPVYPSPYYYGPYLGNQSWEHAAGRTCFDRTIDKDRYEKQQKPM